MSVRRGFAWKWIVVLVLLVAGAWVSFLVYRSVSAPMVSVSHVTEGPVVHAFYATGTLLPLREYPVRANVEGVMTEVLVDKGDKVTKGQRIAFVRVDEVELRYQQAKADYELKVALADEKTGPELIEIRSQQLSVRQQLEIAERELARLTDLAKQNSASMVDVDRASVTVQKLVADRDMQQSRLSRRTLELRKDVAFAKAALDIAEWNRDQQTIVAPSDGVVLDRPIARGTRVRVNDTLTTVADVRPEALVMRASVDEEDKTFVTVGQKVKMTLYSFSGRSFEGKVARVYPKADPVTRTFEVDVEMNASEPTFSAGMTGELAFVISEKAMARAVPTQAVQAGVVYVVVDGKIAVADVKLGVRSVERTEILNGLAPTDKVVVSPIGSMGAGQRVRTLDVDPRDAAAQNRKALEQKPGGFGGG